VRSENFANGIAVGAVVGAVCESAPTPSAVKTTNTPIAMQSATTAVGAQRLAAESAITKATDSFVRGLHRSVR
jgi:hypothetical protein